jgi:acyl carrier protein
MVAIRVTDHLDTLSRIGLCIDDEYRTSVARPLKEETKLGDLGDELNAINLTFLLEEEFGITVDRALTEADTIGEIKTIIESKVKV